MPLLTSSTLPFVVTPCVMSINNKIIYDIWWYDIEIVPPFYYAIIKKSIKHISVDMTLNHNYVNYSVT